MVVGSYGDPCLKPCVPRVAGGGGHLFARSSPAPWIVRMDDDEESMGGFVREERRGEEWYLFDRRYSRVGF